MSVSPERPKPPHAFALVLFGAAVLYVICDITMGYGFHSAMARTPSLDAHMSTMIAAFRRDEDIQLFRSAFLSGLEFIAAGVLIGLLDSLRWILTPEQDRADLADRYIVSGLSRTLAKFRRKDGPE